MSLAEQRTESEETVRRLVFGEGGFAPLGHDWQALLDDAVSRATRQRRWLILKPASLIKTGRGMRGFRFSTVRSA